MVLYYKNIVELVFQLVFKKDFLSTIKLSYKLLYLCRKCHIMDLIPSKNNKTCCF